jgi:hypothetical protein
VYTYLSRESAVCVVTELTAFAPPGASFSALHGPLERPVRDADLSPAPRTDVKSEGW